MLCEVDFGFDRNNCYSNGNLHLKRFKCKLPFLISQLLVFLIKFLPLELYVNNISENLYFCKLEIIFSKPTVRITLVNNEAHLDSLHFIPVLFLNLDIFIYELWQMIH